MLNYIKRQLKSVKIIRKTYQVTKTFINKNFKNKYFSQESIPDKREIFSYLEELNTKAYIEKISKKLEGKSVVIYGAGAFFQTIKEYYDLSKLKIVAVSDRKFSQHLEGETFLDYPICSPEEIAKINPDYVLVATRTFIKIIDELEEDTLKETKIKVRPIIKKTFPELVRDIWG